MNHDLEFKRLYQKSIKILSFKNYSMFEIKKKLISLFPDSNLVTIENVLNYLHELKLVDDERYKEVLIKQYYHKGLQGKIIKRKLAEKGLSADLSEIDVVLTQHNGTEEEQIKKILIKRKNKKTNSNIQYLMRYGHSYYKIIKVLKELDIHLQEDFF